MVTTKVEISKTGSILNPWFIASNEITIPNSLIGVIKSPNLKALKNSLPVIHVAMLNDKYLTIISNKLIGKNMSNEYPISR